MLLQHLSLQPASLPDREISVLDRQLGQRRRALFPECPIERRNLTDENPHGPSVCDDVVQRCQNQMLGPRQAKKLQPEERSQGEIEWPRRLLPPGAPAPRP